MLLVSTAYAELPLAIINCGITGCSKSGDGFGFYRGLCHFIASIPLLFEGGRWRGCQAGAFRRGVPFKRPLKEQVMEYEFQSFLGTNPGSVGTVRLLGRNCSPEIPFYKRGRCLYVDLRQARGPYSLSREELSDLKYHVSTEYDLGMSSNIEHCMLLESNQEFWDNLGERFPLLSSLVYRVRYRLWVCFRPLRHWAKPLMREKFNG